jgi:hypothetical protein
MSSSYSIHWIKLNKFYFGAEDIEQRFAIRFQILFFCIFNEPTYEAKKKFLASFINFIFNCAQNFPIKCFVSKFLYFFRKLKLAIAVWVENIRVSTNLLYYFFCCCCVYNMFSALCGGGVYWIYLLRFSTWALIIKQ